MPQSPLPLLVLLLLLPPSSQHLHYPRNLHFLIFSIARKKRLSHWSWRTKHHCHVGRSSWPDLSRFWLQSWKLCYCGFQPIQPDCRTDSDSVRQHIPLTTHVVDISQMFIITTTTTSKTNRANIVQLTVDIDSLSHILDSRLVLVLNNYPLSPDD